MKLSQELDSLQTKLVKIEDKFQMTLSQQETKHQEDLKKINGISFIFFPFSFLVSNSKS